MDEELFDIEEEEVNVDFNDAQNPDIEEDVDDNDDSSAPIPGLATLYGHPNQTLTRDQRIVIRAAHEIFGISQREISEKLSISRRQVKRAVDAPTLTPNKRRPRPKMITDEQASFLIKLGWKY